MRMECERMRKELAVAYFMLYSRYRSAHCWLTISSRSAHRQITVSSRSTHGQLTVNTRSGKLFACLIASIHNNGHAHDTGNLHGCKVTSTAVFSKLLCSQTPFGFEKLPRILIPLLTQTQSVRMRGIQNF
jgi:hypothetical protein